MKAAWDAGINFFDCAEAYSKGESEKIMGEAIKHFGYRNQPLHSHLPSFLSLKAVR